MGEAGTGAKPDSTVEVPGYTVAERIGVGGFGEVLRARHDAIGRDVAIKVLHARYSTDPEAIARFLAEARAVGKLSHPGIVDLYDFGKLADGRQYCVMELIRGRTLRDLLRERTRIPLDEALPILRGIAEAIDAAHAAGIAHRDLKPDNVFVLDGGGVKLIDFGLAKLAHDDAPVTATGAVFGTPLYMSPEQCRGKAIDLRTDAYSFGVLAYHVLVGKPPFSGDALELALHHLNDKPEPPSTRNSALPERVDRIVLALLDKNPAARPSPLATAVANLVGDHVVAGRRRRWLAPALAVLVIVLAATGWKLAHRRPASSRRGPQTVAVLGFANRGDAEHAWIGTGLVQMLGPALQAGDVLRVPAVNTVGEELEELGIAPTDAPSREDMERIRAAFSPDEVVVGWFRPHAGMIEIDTRLLDGSRELVSEAREDVPEAELPQAALRIADHLRETLGVDALDAGAGAQARKLWPVRVEAMRHYAIGLAASRHEDHAAAIPELTKVTELEPDFALAHYWLATEFEYTDNARQAEEYERALRLSDGLPERERLRFEAESKRRSDPAAAERAYRRAFELDPQDLRAGLALADFNYNIDEGLQMIARMRALPAPASNEPNLDRSEADIAQIRGDFARCMILATRSEASALRARRPNMVLDARTTELTCLLGQGKLDELLELVDDILARARASGASNMYYAPYTLWMKCQALHQRGDLGGAEHACRDAVAALLPTSTASTSRDVWVSLAGVLVAENKLDDARSALSTAERVCAGARPPCHLDRRTDAALHASLGEVGAQRSTLVAMLAASRAAHWDLAANWALHDLARADHEQLRSGDDCTAEVHDAIAIADAHPDLISTNDRADNYRLLGRILGDRGRFDEAIAAQQKAVDMLKHTDDTGRRSVRSYGSITMLMADRAAEAEQWARDALVGDGSLDEARAALVEALVAQAKLADADKVVTELTGTTSDATFARAWVALHHGKPARAERGALATQLADLKKRSTPIEIARLELRIARLAVAANEPDARKRLSALADDLRKKNLGGFAALAQREATARP